MQPNIHQTSAQWWVECTKNVEGNETLKKY